MARVPSFATPTIRVPELRLFSAGGGGLCRGGGVGVGSDSAIFWSELKVERKKKKKRSKSQSKTKTTKLLVQLCGSRRTRTMGLTSRPWFGLGSLALGPWRCLRLEEN